jgi:hypothetical protein
MGMPFLIRRGLVRYEYRQLCGHSTRETGGFLQAGFPVGKKRIIDLIREPSVHVIVLPVLLPIL